jgi:hypothetical protein
MTRFGGLVLFRQFCKSLDLRHFVQLYVRWPNYAHRSYHPADLFLAHVFAIVAGIGRIENTQSLTHNGLLPPLLGLPDFPHRDTLRAFLWRFDTRSLRSLQSAHDKLRAEFFRRLSLLYSAIVDADTTTLITYGSQEGVAVGYIPKRRHGQPSYAPIISSEGRSGLSLGMDLRAGNVHASKEAWGFLQSILNKLPSSNCIQPHARATGWSFLQQGDHRTPRPRTTGLCGCSQDDPTVEKKDGGCSIRTVRPRLGGSRVHLHTLSLERRTPVRCGTKTRGFGDRRNPAAFVHLQALHLPQGAGDQPGADRSSILALLLRPGVSGAFAARVQRFLRHGQNPYPQFLGQRGLHGDPSVGLRFGSGLPGSLLAQASAALEYLHLAPRALVVARGVGQTRKQKLPQAPGALSAAGAVPKDSVGYFESPALDLNPFATNFQNRTREP